MPRGQCCRLPVPCGHYKTTPVSAALRTSGLTATAIFEGATNGRRFLNYVTATLVPVFRPGDSVIPDNLQAHKVTGMRGSIAAACAQVVYLPLYSPEFDPIEQTFAAFTPQGRRSYLDAADYQTDCYVSA